MIVYLFPPLCVLLYLCGLWFFSPFGNQALPFPGSFVHGNKRINEEEAENAEVFFRKSLGSSGLPGSFANRSVFILAPWTFNSFYLCVLRDLCG
jgi:hypothetical protein